MCGRRWQADGGNLYITRACADFWKGTRQLVYELIVLSFFLPPSLSLSLSLSLPPALCGLSPFHSVLPSPCHSVLPSPCHLVLLSPCHSVSSSCSVSFGLCLRFTRFGLRVPFRLDSHYAAAYLSYS